MLPSEALERLRREGVTLAILFGSRATGRVHPRSDWDIGVLAPAGADLDRTTADLERLLGGRVDLVELRRASPLLKMRCVREGKVLLDATGSELAAFASLALRSYEDTRKLRDAQAASLAVFLRRRGLA